MSAEPIEKIRLFIACWPPAEMQQKFTQVTSSFPSSHVRTIRPDQIHITLQFLGSVPVTLLPDLTSALKQNLSTRPSFHLSVSGIGAFPSLKRPKIIWAGVGGDILSLNKLQSAVTKTTSQFGFIPEERPFKPHLTLARVKDVNAKDLKVVSESVNFGSSLDFGPWAVSEVLLVQSKLSPQGASYSELERFGLILPGNSL